MIHESILVLTFLSMLGCGLMAGFFFAFSNCVMKALSRLPPAQGIAAMQTINVVVLNPLFFVVFLGTAAACVLLGVSTLLMWDGPHALYRLIASGLYLVGTLMVTMAFNVPRNNALASVQADSSDGAKRWEQFLPGWTAWNHVRAAAALLAAALFIVSLWTRDLGLVVSNSCCKVPSRWRLNC
jgi:uncharacterized membrane protein